MAVATDTLKTDLLSNLFNNAAIAGLGDATGLRGSAAAGSFYISLHTADPGKAGTQSTSEATYTGYARVGVPRTAGGWTVTGSAVTNAAGVQFATATGGSNTITHVGIGTAGTGAGKLLYRLPLQNPSSFAVSAGIALKLDPGVINLSVD